MSDPVFPKPAAEVVATLADIFRHQGQAEVVELLENAHAWFDNTDYDNWNSGTYIWALRLEVPVPLFAPVETRLPKIEKEITDRLKYFSRLDSSHYLKEATISPITPGAAVAGQRIAPADTEVRRLWPNKQFRLFLSHVSKHKLAVSKLKDELELFGISAFVAHEAIKPSLEWLREIELALRSMHALLALRSGISSRAPIGHLVINTKPMATNQGCKGLVPGSQLQHKFLYYYLSSIVDLLNSLGTGTTFKELSGSKLKEVPVPITSLPEQQRIVGLLDEAFAGIATAKTNAEKNLQNAHALFDSLLNVAIQGKLIPQDSRDTSVVELTSQIERARNIAIDQGRAQLKKTEPVKFKDGTQLKLPKSWQWTQLESLTVGISDGVHKKPQYVSKGIPFITVRNLTAGTGISFDDLNYITREDHKEFIKRTHPERGDILITKDGTIGVVRLIETDIEFSIFVSVALIKPVLRELGPYLVYALRASCVQSQIVPQGAALKHLYLVDLRRLAIPLWRGPFPDFAGLALQRRQSHRRAFLHHRHPPETRCGYMDFQSISES